MYGYVKPTRARHNPPEVGELRSAAANFDLHLKRVFVEPLAPTDLLWELIAGVDRHCGGVVLATIEDLASRRGIDIPRLLEDARTRVPPVAWQALLAELHRAGGGCILVPDPTHLDGLAETRAALLQRLSRTHPGVRVSSLPGLVELSPPTSSRPRPVVAGSTLVGEFEVQASRSGVKVALLKARWHLAHTGLSDYVEDVAAVLRALIDQRVDRPAHADEAERIRIRLRRNGHVLVIDVHEPDAYRGELVPDSVARRCLRVRRFTPSQGGTGTRCELALDDREVAAPTTQPGLPRPREGGW
ncbi:hypothetical protein GZH49_12005 [Nocardia terpenica]|uniref:hypothetical protein n=1 Tax=Nocardia terpenica TaxID=455432 RepID=UPI002FE2FECE